MITKILFASHNPSKFKRFKDSIDWVDLGLELVTSHDLNLPIQDPDETGATEKENAKIKADAYYKISKIPSLALDTGFYIENYPPEKQPGKHVQRIAGVLHSDSDDQRFEKMSQYYINIAKEFGGKAKAYFLDVFCLFDGRNYFYEEAKRSALITDKVNFKDVHFPIASVYKVSQFGKYYHDLSPEEMREYIQPSLNAVKKIILDYSKN
ncbi:MAG: non-canonical purine NTP pyrophosphatase [bacterium]